MSTPSLPGYENLTLIGKGGFSRVYRADQSKLKRKVAVKVLNFGLSDEADRTSFARETELMGRVSTHPNIVTVHDTAFTANGQPCIVMEHYPGGSLADLIGEIGQLQPKEALEVGVAIASALEASHQSGVLHCDLKPQNILISEFGQPALGDFGISTFAEERTRTGQDAGAGFTLPYAAPEIVEGESPTVTSDVYSLAATLYTSLCGRRPFAYPTAGESKPTAAEQARRILLEDVPALSEEHAPHELDQVIRWAMSKEPANRPQSAAEFATALHRIGQSLGHGTSSPRIATQGALPIIDSDAVGAGQIDLSVLVPRRQAGVATPAASDPSGAPLLYEETPSARGLDLIDARPQEVSRSRRQIAVGIGLAALVAVAALLYLASRGTDDAAEPEPLTPAAPAVVASDPVLAPTRPADVTLQRLGDHAVGVSWDAPVDEVESGDVTYEIRRQDGGLEAPVTSTTSDALLDAVADDEGLCVTVLAVRANRTSSPTEPACIPALAITVALNPPTCAITGCDVALTMTDAAAGTQYSVAVYDRSLQDMTGAGFLYNDAATIGANGESDWQLSTTEAEPGGYLVVVTSSDGETQTALLTIE